MKTWFSQMVSIGISLAGILTPNGLRAENNLPPSLLEIQRNQAATQAILDKWNLPPSQRAPAYRPAPPPSARSSQDLMAETQRNLAATQAILDKWNLAPSQPAPAYRPAIPPSVRSSQDLMAETQRNLAATQAILDKWDREEKAKSQVPVKAGRVEALSHAIDRLITSVSPPSP